MLLPTTARALKLEATGGVYSFNATNNRNNTSSGISGLGSYRLGTQIPLSSRIGLDLGYSLLATEVIGGDLSFGFDLGFIYFPLTTSDDIKMETENVSAVFQNRWRPFIGLAFHQRNFQSTSSQYAGGGLKLGTEFQLWPRLSITGCVRYISLSGPNHSEATQIDVMSGILVHF